MSVMLNTNSTPVILDDVYNDAYSDAYIDVYKDEYTNDAYYQKIYDGFSEQAYNQAYNDFMKGTRGNVVDNNYVSDGSKVSAEEIYYDIYYDTYYKHVYSEAYNDAYNQIYEDSIKGSTATLPQIASRDTTSASNFFSLLNLNPVFLNPSDVSTSPKTDISGNPLADFAAFLGQPILPTLPAISKEASVSEDIVLEKDVFH